MPASSNPVPRGQKATAGLFGAEHRKPPPATAGLIFAPLIHRLLHRFHADDSENPSA